jgi:hypothetical protein
VVDFSIIKFTWIVLDDLLVQIIAWSVTVSSSRTKSVRGNFVQLDLIAEKLMALSHPPTRYYSEWCTQTSTYVPDDDSLESYRCHPPQELVIGLLHHTKTCLCESGVGSLTGREVEWAYSASRLLAILINSRDKDDSSATMPQLAVP